MTLDYEFDRVLDDALAEYRDAEPLAGMEDRVLRRVKSQAERRRKPGWQWSAMVAAAALALAVGIGLSGHARHRASSLPLAQQQALPAEPPSQTVDTQPMNTPASRPMQAAKAIRQGNRGPQQTAQLARSETAPTREHFPSPVPLQAEERTLLALAQTHPEVLRDLSRSENDQEISIAPINIKPLADKTAGTQGED
jgi:hypothetical protein